MEENKELRVQMLGGFSVRYGEEDVVLGRNTTGKFIQLLQLVWLQGDKGITKEQLIHSLYERDSFSNINNSFNNLIYQMRKQMVKAGLPERNYIEKRGGLFVPDRSVDLYIDVDIFKEHIRRAREAYTDEEKAALYRTASDVYTGELLPELKTETWVVLESVELRKAFEESVNWLGGFYRGKEDYDGLYQVFSHAAEIYPADDYQVHQIDALILKGEYKEAYRLYHKAVKYYNEDLGIPPSEKLLACYKEMADKVTFEPGHIDEIRSELTEGKSAGEAESLNEGAYYCPYPSFIDNYRIMSRNMKRGGQSIFMMMCTLVDYEGKLITNQDKLRTRSAILKQALQYALRGGDTFTQYTNSQYLILLTGTTREGCDVVYQRIIKKLRELSPSKIDIRYNATSLAELDEEVTEAADA